MTNKQITVSRKPSGPSCGKCGRLSTAMSVISCAKGHDHFNAEGCPDYDDRSKDVRFVGGGTTGIFYER